MTKRLRYWLGKKRVAGGGYETILVILTLILVAPVYILLSWAMTNVNTLQTTIWTSGYYDADSNTFLTTWWLWLPIIIFILCMVYLVVRYQRRDPMSDY